VRTREPGGSSGAEAIRALLVTGDPGRWDAETEALLVYAARRDHVARTISPALARGAWVLCDRFADSTMAYQGYGHGLGRAFVEALHRLVLGDLKPDLTFVFDLPVAAGLARAGRRPGQETRFERMDAAFHERLRAGFQEIAAREPGRCVLIDARPGPDQVEQAILAALDSRLPRS
jgi:dTMP kinase